MKRVVLVYVLAPLLLTAIAFVAFLPAWLHVLDTKPPVSVTPTAHVMELATDLAKTHHVALTGAARPEAAVVQRTTTKMNGSDVPGDEIVLVPMVEEGFQPGQKASVVLATKAADLQQTQAVSAAQGTGGRVAGAPMTAKGEVRSVLWESGFTPAQRELFAASGTPLTENAVLVTREGTRSDGFWAYGVAGLAFVLGLLGAEGYRRVARRGQRTRV
ncbi:MAG: hypothetical protein JWP97_1387 [Labilithrix sp.]|nr:hypothetical protein [Labilithrix sp.]